MDSFKVKYPGVEDSSTTNEDLFDDFHSFDDLVIYQITNPNIKTLEDCINFTTSVSEILECIWVNDDMFDPNSGMAPFYHWEGLEVRLDSDKLNLV